MAWFPQVLVTAVAVQVFCQLFKLVYYSARDRKLTLSYLVTAGAYRARIRLS